MTRQLTILFFAATVLASSSGAGITDLPDDSFLWNEFRAVQVVDSFAIAASDYGLAALKLNATTGFFDPVNHLLLNTQPVGVKVVDYIALVSSAAGLTYLVDLSELPQLHLLGELDMGSSAFDLALSGDDLFIACGFQGLRHYHLTDYASPEFIDSSLVGVHCIQVEILGNDLLVLDDYNAVLRYDLTEPGIASPADLLWLPRRAQGFFNIRDTLVIPIVDQPFLYRGLLNSTESRLLDSTVLGLIPESVYAIDTFLVAVDTDRHLMEVVSTEGNGHNLYDIHWYRGLNPIGCTYYEANVPHLMLTSDYNGLVSFNLKDIWFDPVPREAYSRPGPITTLTFQNDRLFTGGERNPLESYLIDPDGRVVFDTALYGLNNVGSVIPAEDVVLAHFPSVGMLSAIRFDTGSIETLGSLTIPSQSFRSIKYDPFDQVDSLSMALAVTTNRVNIIGISNDWQMTWIDDALTSEEILDVIVIDSFLMVTTVDPKLYVFKLYNSLTPVYWWGLSTPGPINHMVVVDEREADDGSWWYPRTFLGFDGNQMYEIIFRPDVTGNPFGFLDLGLLPVDVISTAQGNNMVFTIGDQGVGVLDMTQPTPTMIEHGGFGGHLISFDDSTLATSDGSAVHLFQYETSTTPEPEGDVVLASATEYLKPNYPNPFNPVTRIDFDLPRSSQVDVSVFNLLGRKVINLLSGPIEAGLHSVEWDGTDPTGRRVASGVYFYRLTTPTLSETRKMVLLK
jgi:hypothetical protein